MALLRYGLALVLIAALQSGGIQSQAPGLSDAQAKAAVLYNLAMFVQWPEEALPSSERQTIGIVRADPVLTAMHGIEGRIANGHAVRIVDVRPETGPHLCHIVYLPDLDRDSKTWLEKVGRRPILTVGDDERFLRSGGIVRLSVEESRIRFDIDVGNAERAGLKISSKVLMLARVVRDGRTVKD